ncbi:Threonine/homoserine/homoserine lactone efflux protein [Persephonella hydrogeniphila]|uniref:Threonine/homoserine/homoserine lactone efflux protein n=1 Tax=Persephonella hydrogeniphila TaxID=198703 RepID=A0A285NQ50_9AQUI|nr:LysE family translocator [Persephonella hydrogeniphila]SNZ11097.1 Threonine/homoserine/homoserine lactone efflux protein [Persephonella hydrogeniphila]
MYIQDILTGLTFGIAAGLSPGPLMALLISETIKGHKKNGIFVSISPVITDIPILLLSLFILDRIRNIEYMTEIISVIGAFVLFYFGYKNIKIETYHVETDITGSLKKGILLNILNPYTYLFWFFIGAPYVEKAGFTGGILFTVSFFIGITGSMMLIALFTEKIKKFIESRYYIYLLRFIGIVFILFGIFLLKDAYHLLLSLTSSL